jgi:hypothetical protein
LGSPAKKMLCRLRMLDFPENEDCRQRVSRSGAIVAADAPSNNYPQHLHSLTRGKSGWLTKTCCAQIHRL